MGQDKFSLQDYTDRMTRSTTAPGGYFTHTAKIKSAETQAKVHTLLDPARPNRAGIVTRESFDSPTNPVSTAVGVLFDVTGSMSSVPKVFVTKLGQLMQQLGTYALQDPHVLFGAIGDAYSDRAPLQIGQFEAGNAMDETLSQIYLEEGGGGTGQESYELGMYYLAKYANIDCINKRNKKGYLFFIGDELPYGRVDPDLVKEFIGDKLEAPIATTDILAELGKKFNVFWLFPKGTSHYTDPKVNMGLARYFGNNLIKLEDPSLVSEVIATVIALHEGRPTAPIEATLTADVLAPIIAQFASCAPMPEPIDL